MHRIWLIAIVGTVAVFAIAGLSAFRHRPTRAPVLTRVSEPRAYVEVLTTQTGLPV
jgi:hypothetical protein